MKQCPVCFKMLSEDKDLCIYCGKDLTDVKPVRENRENITANHDDQWENDWDKPQDKKKIGIKIGDNKNSSKDYFAILVGAISIATIFLMKTHRLRDLFRFQRFNSEDIILPIYGVLAIILTFIIFSQKIGSLIQILLGIGAIYLLYSSLSINERHFFLYHQLYPYSISGMEKMTLFFVGIYTIFISPIINNKWIRLVPILTSLSVFILLYFYKFSIYQDILKLEEYQLFTPLVISTLIIFTFNQKSFLYLFGAIVLIFIIFQNYQYYSNIYDTTYQIMASLKRTSMLTIISVTILYYLGRLIQWH